MRVMLAQDDWPGGLGSPNHRAALLKPFPAGRMEHWSVGKAVGSVRNEWPEMVDRVAS